MNTTDVKAFFDRVASDCDTMRIAYYDQRVIDRLGALADLTPDMVVADVGTGTGCVAAGIAPRVARVIGIDISPSTPRSLPPPVCPSRQPVGPMLTWALSAPAPAEAAA